MDISSKNQREITTELGGLAVCITSTVGFMVGAAYARALFGGVEWWFFFGGGLGWLTWMAIHFRKTHEFAFLWRENRLLSQHLREMGESFAGTLKDIDALREKEIARLQGAKTRPIATVEPEKQANVGAEKKNQPDDFRVGK